MLLTSNFLANSVNHISSVLGKSGAEMKVAIVASLLAKRDVNINASHLY